MVFLYEVSMFIFLATSYYHSVIGTKLSTNFNINDKNFPFVNNISPNAFFSKHPYFKHQAKPFPQKEPTTKTQFPPFPQKFPFFKPQVLPWRPSPPPITVKPVEPEDPLIPIPPGMPIPPEALHSSRPLPPGTRLCFLPPPRNSKSPPPPRVVPCNPEPQDNPEPQECAFTADCSKPGAKCYRLAVRIFTYFNNLDLVQYTVKVPGNVYL